MSHCPDTPFGKHLDCIKDPRRHNKQHMLQDMLMISLCAIISGADCWTQVAEYGRSKLSWFSDFLKLPNGIASHDTFGRLFAMIDPKGFQNFFTGWVREISESLKGVTVAIDGKTLRGSHDKALGKSAIHMVSAWASDIGLVPGQLKTNDKSNEITAIAGTDQNSCLARRGCYISYRCIRTLPCFSKTRKMPALILSKPLMATMAASKPGSIFQPITSIGWPESINGQALKASVWLFASAMLTQRYLLKAPILSPACQTMPQI